MALEEQEDDQRGQGEERGGGHGGPQSVPKVFWKDDSQTGRVRLSCCLMIRKLAYANSFQAVMNPKSEVAIRPGASRGSATRRKASVRVQPSTCAASSSSGGMVAMKPRSTTIVNGSVIMK